MNTSPPHSNSSTSIETTEPKEIQTETGHQLFNRLRIRPRLENLHPALTLPTTGQTAAKPNQIIQITGAPNTGKSLLIAEFLIHTILPKNLCENFKECSAILINTDHQISVIQIIKLAEEKLSSLNIPCNLHLEIIKSSLKRLIILNSYSIEQFRMTLLNLEHILSSNLDIALIAIDSLSAYYWCERYTFVANISDNSDQKEMFSVNKHCCDLLKSLKSVIDDRQVVVVFSKYETVSSLMAMIDVSIQLKKVDKSDKDLKKVEIDKKFLLEILDLETQVKFGRYYKIEKFIVFEDE